MAPKLNDKLLDIVADVPALFAETDDLLDNDAQEPAFTIQRICIMQRYSTYYLFYFLRISITFKMYRQTHVTYLAFLF